MQLVLGLFYLQMKQDNELAYLDPLSALHCTLLVLPQGVTRTVVENTL